MNSFKQPAFIFHDQVLEEFYNIFGPELKAVTGDPKRIENVLKRVDGLVVPIENVKAEPFDLKSHSTWKTVMNWFDREVQAIEGRLLFYTIFFL